jgi:hypothetical protein
MAYPNSFEDFIKELRQDDDRAYVSSADLMTKGAQLLSNLKTDYDRGAMFEVLGLDHSEDEMAVIEAVLRTFFLMLYPGKSYKPVDS